MSEQSSTAGPAFKDPRPSVERISRLAQRVLTGDIILPKFQRDFVWPRAKILGLLDSIARNYPIGSILLWQSNQELASERTIGGLQIANERPGYPVNYLLDGQQRLSTLCGALYWKPGDDPNSLWNIAYDLRTTSFIHLFNLNDPPLSQVPLRYLSDAATYFRRVTALDDAGLRDRADALFNRIQDYMIAAVTLADMPIADLAPIFERVNSTATPLTIVDLMRAATWSPDFDLRDSMDEIRDKLQLRDFGSVDRKTILRIVSAAAGFGFRAEDIDRLRPKRPITAHSTDTDSKGTDLKQVLADAAAGADRAVDFLTTHIRAPRPEALPYTNQFAVLSELFRRIPAPTGDQFAAIERWFWRSTLSGYFGGWNTGQMARDYEAIKQFATEETVTDIPVEAALPRDEIWSVTQFRSNSAVAKMLALMMSYHDPVDLMTGQRIDARKSLAWSNDREYHHLFPKAFLKGKVTPGRANAMANIILLTSASNIRISNKAPSQYLSALILDVGRDEVIKRLASVLVSEAALDAALADDYSAFLKARAVTLQENALGLTGEEIKDATAEPSGKVDEVFVDDSIDVDWEAPGEDIEPVAT